MCFSIISHMGDRYSFGFGRGVKRVFLNYLSYGR